MFIYKHGQTNKEQRHRCMSAIKGKDTKPELLVRKFLFSRGLDTG